VRRSGNARKVESILKSASGNGERVGSAGKVAD